MQTSSDCYLPFLVAIVKVSELAKAVISLVVVLGKSLFKSRFNWRLLR